MTGEPGGPLRVLALSNVPLDEASGSGHVVLGFARGLRELGHRVDLLGPADHEPLHGWSRGIRYRQALGMAASSLRRLAEDDYDVIEYYGAEAWLAISLLRRVPQRPFLLVSHSNGLETHCAEVLAQARAAGLAEGPRRWYQRDHPALAALAFRGADALVTVGSYDRDYALRERYAAPERILAIENPLPDSFLGREVDFRRGPAIGYCGSWIPRKGTALLTAALVPFLREHPAWRLVLAGVGAGFRAGEHFPADLSARIEVVPQAERTTGLRALYERLAVLVLPSLYESFGLAAAEAMACGCALVATPTGFAAGLRDGEEALLVRERSAGALDDALRRLAASEELRQAIAKGGYRRVQGLCWERAAATLDAAYRRWLGEVRHGGRSRAGGGAAAEPRPVPAGAAARR